MDLPDDLLAAMHDDNKPTMPALHDHFILCSSCEWLTTIDDSSQIYLINLATSSGRRLRTTPWWACTTRMTRFSPNTTARRYAYVQVDMSYDEPCLEVDEEDVEYCFNSFSFSISFLKAIEYCLGNNYTSIPKILEKSSKITHNT